MALTTPKLPAVLQQAEDDFAFFAQQAAQARDNLEELHSKTWQADRQDFSGLSLSYSLIESARLIGCHVKRSSFADVIFRQCDFSGSNFSDSRFARCSFEGCKGLGAIFAACYFQDVSFTNCNMQMSNFSASRMFFIQMHYSDFSSADLSSCEIKSIDFHEAKLCGASLYKTPLKGVDLSGCDIAGLGVTAECKELKGAVIDPWQAAELAPLLGIKIK